MGEVSDSVPGKLPGTCHPDQLIRDWCTAVAAYRLGDTEAVAAVLFPELSDGETYARTVALTVLAATLCGERVRENLTPALGFCGYYTLRTRNQRTGGALNPDDCVEAANAVAVGRLVTAAANRDAALVNDLALAHMPPRSDPRRILVLGDLLGIYCETPAGGVAP